MQTPEPVQFDKNDERSYRFEPTVEAPRTLVDAVVKQGTTRNSLIARILLIIFTIIFFTLAILIIKFYVIDVV